MSAAVSGCCEKMQNILMLYLNWHGFLYWEVLLSQWEPGDFWGTLLSNPAAKIALWREPCQIHLHFPQKIFLHVVHTWRIHVITSASKPNISVVSHVKQIFSTIPFHQIKVKLNSIAIASMVYFLVRISTETN